MAETKFKLSVDGVQGVVGGFDRVKNSIAGVASSTSMLMSLGGVLSVGAFAGLIKSQIDLADSLGDLSVATGITVEELTGLDWAAKMSGTSLESVAKAINKLGLEMGKDAEKFRSIGVTAKEPVEAFLQFVDVLNRIEDPQKRAVVANAALGRSYEELAPLLAEGREGIEKLITKGKELSGITTEMSEEAGKFNDALDELKARAAQLGIGVASDLLPFLSLITSDMKNAATAASGLGNQFNPLSETLRALMVLGGNVKFVFKGIGTEIGGISAQAAELAKGNFSAARQIGVMMKEDAEAARKAFDEWEKKVMTLGKSVSQSTTAALAGAITPSGVNPASDDLDLSNFFKAGDDAAKKHSDALRRSEEFIAAIQKENALLGASAAERKAFEAEAMAGQMRLAGVRDDVLLKFLNNSAREAEALEHKRRLIEHEAEVTRHMEQLSGGLIAQGRAELDSIQAQLQAERLRNEELGLTTEQLGELHSKRLENEAANEREMAQTVRLAAAYAGPLHDAYLMYADDLEAAAKAKEALADEKRSGAARQAFIDDEKKAAEAFTRVWNEAGDNVQRNLGQDLRKVLEGDFDDIGSAWKSMLTQMLADALAADLRAALFGDGPSNHTGSLFGGASKLLGGIFGGGADPYSMNMPDMGSLYSWADSFDGGGYTGDGRRAGGLDGKGGFLAMLHPQETVLDHTKGQGTGGRSVSLSVTQTIHIDSRSDRAAVQRDMLRVKDATRAQIMEDLRREGVI